MPETMTEQIAPPVVPTCATQKCKRPLTWLEKSGCWRCLVCNPFTELKPAEEKKRTYIDVTMTEKIVREIAKEESGSAIDEDKIREIVRDELADWHIQKPPITRDEIAEAVGVGDSDSNVHIEVKVPKPETWLQKAKRLGVQTHKESGGMRKKVEIMADVEAKEREADETVSEELRTEEQTGSGGGERPSVDTGDAEASE